VKSRVLVGEQAQVAQLVLVRVDERLQDTAAGRSSAAYCRQRPTALLYRRWRTWEARPRLVTLAPRFADIYSQVQRGVGEPNPTSTVNGARQARGRAKMCASSAQEASSRASLRPHIDSI